MQPQEIYLREKAMQKYPVPWLILCVVFYGTFAGVCMRRTCCWRRYCHSRRNENGHSSCTLYH